MNVLHVLILAIVQGLAELLPVSSSAHVIVAAKFLGEDMKSPANTLLLVMLHTGTMFAVILYFWRQWRRTVFSSKRAFQAFALRVILATALTAVVGYPIVKAIEHVLGKGQQKAEIEQLFDRLNFISPALAAAGILILLAGLKERPTKSNPDADPAHTPELTLRQSSIIGAVQGLCLPFRGFSRSGATISAGMLAGAAKARAESFSFALAVVLTPPVVYHELSRLLQSRHELLAAGGTPDSLSIALLPCLLGMLFSFAAGLLALRWLSRWLDAGRWYLFGLYCLAASIAVCIMYLQGM
jgi:undecaprenyl-diphosphatase